MDSVNESDIDFINQPSDTFTVEYNSDIESEGKRNWINRCNLLENIIQDLK